MIRYSNGPDATAAVTVQLNDRLAVPPLPSATVTVTAYGLPAAAPDATVPVICPVDELIDNPAGNPDAEKLNTSPSASDADTGTDTGALLPDVSALSYEEARDALVRVVADLEQGASTLEESIALWERGEALAARCEEWLLGAKARLDAARTTASDAG